MDKTRLAVCLPGGGSPYFSSHKSNYKFIAEVFDGLGLDTILIDYVGEGQWPIFNNGILISQASQKVLNYLKDIKEPFVVYARCLGTLVFFYLISNFNTPLSTFCRKIVLWGMPSWDFMNDLFSNKYRSISGFNKDKAMLSGFMLHNDFYNEVLVLKEKLLSPSFRFDNIDLYMATGYRDNQSDENFRQYIRSSLLESFRTVNCSTFDALHAEESLSEQSANEFRALIKGIILNE